MVDNLLERCNLFFGLFRGEKARVENITIFVGLGPSVVGFEKFELHDVSWYEGCPILLAAEFCPVDVCEPGMLLDFAHRLGTHARIFA